MNGMLTLGAAVLLGLAASGHCLVMCGGISAALGMAAAKDSEGRTRLPLLIGYQLGRMSAYSLAGLMLAGIFGVLIGLLDIEAVRRTLRVLSALALVLAALVAFGRLRDPGSGIGRKVWRRLAPLGRRLLLRVHVRRGGKARQARTGGTHGTSSHGGIRKRAPALMVRESRVLSFTYSPLSPQSVS